MCVPLYPHLPFTADVMTAISVSGVTSQNKRIFHWFYCDWWVQAPWHAAPMRLKLLTWWLKIWWLCSSDKEKIKGEKQFPKFCFCFSAKVQE